VDNITQLNRGREKSGHIIGIGILWMAGTKAAKEVKREFCEKEHVWAER
jgi:hypothetical protein